MNVLTLSAQQLRRAAKIKDKIEDLQIELSRILGDKGDDSSGQPAEPKKKRRRRRTAAQKAKLSAALKASWAARKAKKK